MLPGFCLGVLIAQGLEGYSRVPQFDQNTVRDSEKNNGIRDLIAAREAGFEKIWPWILEELEKKTIFRRADDGDRDAVWTLMKKERECGIRLSFPDPSWRF